MHETSGIMDIARIMPESLEGLSGSSSPLRIEAHAIAEVRLTRSRPEVVLRDGRIAFGEAGKRRALELFCRIHAIARVERTNVWSLLCEPFLDRALAEDVEAFALQMLAGKGVDAEEVAEIRRRIEPQMLRYNAALWDWVNLGHRDVLEACEKDAAFQRWTFEISHRARVRASLFGPCVVPQEEVYDRIVDAWSYITTGAESLESRDALLSLRDRLLAAWTSPGRHYHGWRHLHDVLEATMGAPSRRAMALAAFFHDAVYDTHRADNEELSALWLEREAPMHMPHDIVALAARIVRSTAHPLEEHADLCLRAFFDADFAVLARPPEDYDAYTREVQAEWHHVPQAAFRLGRLAFLEGVLAVAQARGHLFWNAEPIEEWMAMQNLMRERDALSGV